MPIYKQCDMLAVDIGKILLKLIIILNTLILFFFKDFDNIGANKRDFFTNFSKNSRANKLLSILH